MVLPDVLDANAACADHATLSARPASREAGCAFSAGTGAKLAALSRLSSNWPPTLTSAIPPSGSSVPPVRPVSMPVDVCCQRRPPSFERPGVAAQAEASTRPGLTMTPK